MIVLKVCSVDLSLSSPLVTSDLGIECQCCHCNDNNNLLLITLLYTMGV